MEKTAFICTLSEDVQNAILLDLEKLNLSEEDVRLAMDGRLCDLEDTMDISKYL